MINPTDENGVNQTGNSPKGNASDPIDDENHDNVPLFEIDGDRPKTTESNEGKWTNLFNTRLTAKGMKLGFVPPTIKEGSSVVKLQKEKIDQMNDKWLNAVVMYVVGETPTITAITNFLYKDWKHLHKPDIYKHDDGYFVLRFASMADRDEVLCAGPHSFRGKPVIMKPWSPTFNFHEEVLKVIPLWVRLPNLPLNCWSGDSLSRISSVVGVPRCADECTTHQLRVSFARVLIEVNVTQPLPDKVTIVGPTGEMFDQKVVFEWKPPFCKVCKYVGHDCEAKAVQAKAAYAKVQPQKKI